MSTQQTCTLTQDSIVSNNRNLSKPSNLLSTLSSNGKENIATLDNAFNDYFKIKHSMNQLASIINRKDVESTLQMNLHDVKFTHAMCSRSWNRSCYPFLGCHCKRRDSFKPDHVCCGIEDEEHVFYYDHEKAEQEEELRNEPNSEAINHKHWCAANNFGVNNFGLDHQHLSLSRIRYNFGLHVPCDVVRKLLHWLIKYEQRCENSNEIHLHFESLCVNAFYLNQFKNGEVGSQIDGSHAKLFILTSIDLLDLINNTCIINSILNNFIELLKLLSSSHAFWTKVNIGYPESYEDNFTTY